MSMKLQLTTIAALLSVSGISQAALTTSSGATAFNGSAQVTASQSYPNTPSGTGPLNATNTNNGASIANVGLSQFNAATGVLTGVDLQVSSSRSQTISGSGYKGNGAGKTASGNGSSTASVTAAGASLAFLPAIALTGGSCSLATGGTGSISCNWGPTNSATTTTNGSAAVNSANLNDYVGGGSVNASLTTPSLSVTDTQSTNQGQASGSSATYKVTWSGNIQANYSYLLHADGSFNGSTDQNSLTLDFGNVAQNSAPSTLGFSIFNLLSADRTGLDLNSFAGSGDTGRFSSGLGSFTNMAAGSGTSPFNASLLTDTLGTFSAQYIINLSDTASIGASSTRLNQTLTLNLIGNVTAVPVPSAVWLFGSALLGFLGVSRRKA